MLSWPRVLAMCVAISVATRILVLLAGLAAVTVIGFPPDATLPPPTSPSIVLDLPARWDSGWYVGLASGGYRWDGQLGRFENIAFFPAYPLALRMAASALQVDRTSVAWNWVGVGLSTALFSVALAYLWHLAALFTQEARARWAIALCATYPFGIYFGLPYTESLFLLCTAATVYHFLNGQFAVALLFGTLVGLTRPNGLMVSGVLFLIVLGREFEVPGLVNKAAGSWPPQTSHDATTRRIVAMVAAAGPLLGMAVYSAYVFGLTGAPFSWASAQEGWGRPTQNPFSAFAEWVAGASSTSMLLSSPATFLNGLAGVFALALALPVALRMGAAFGVMVMMGVMIPLTAGGVPSLGRYTSVLFPLFIWLALALSTRTVRTLAIVFAVLQTAIAAMFFTWRPMY